LLCELELNKSAVAVDVARTCNQGGLT